jgi:thiol-disulfide isomerase/thioredoxin
MKITREHIINGLLLVLLILILFTPIGFKFKVFANRIFAGSAKELGIESQHQIDLTPWQLTDKRGLVNWANTKDKVVFINFWATWCPPCVAEMPSIQGLYDKYGEKVVFLMVAEDETEKVTSFLHNNDYDFPVYYTRSGLPDELQTGLLPTTIVLDKNHQLHIKETGAANWNSNSIHALIDRLLSE